MYQMSKPFKPGNPALGRFVVHMSLSGRLVSACLFDEQPSVFYRFAKQMIVGRCVLSWMTTTLPGCSVRLNAHAESL